MLTSLPAEAEKTVLLSSNRIRLTSANKFTSTVGGPYHRFCHEDWHIVQRCFSSLNSGTRQTKL